MDELLELVEDEENGRAHLNLTAQQVRKSAGSPSCSNTRKALI